MVMRNGVSWTTSPVKNIGIPVRNRAALVPEVVFRVGTTGAQKWKSRAQQVRPWTDRTNYARSGLDGEAQREGDNTVLQVFHNAEYGIYLETGTELMDAYASILPAMNEVTPEIVKDAQTAIQRVMAGGR